VNRGDSALASPYRYDAQPQAHQPDQADGQLHRQARHVEQGCHHALENGRVAQAEPLVKRADEGDDKKAQPDAVQHRLTCSALDSAGRLKQKLAVTQVRRILFFCTVTGRAGL
jgi:hypothetical protein